MHPVHREARHVKNRAMISPPEYTFFGMGIITIKGEMEKESDSVPSSSTTALFDFSGDIHGLFCATFSLTGLLFQAKKTPGVSENHFAGVLRHARRN